MIIKIKNNLTEQAEKSYLTNQEVSGASAIRWKNPGPFSASWAVQIGKIGEQQSEIRVLTSDVPNGTAGTLTAVTKFEHPSDTPVYAIKYDQFVFERSVTGTTGTATPITGGTVYIQPDSIYTQFDDTTGSISYGYRGYYKNSVSGVTTTESDWITSTGFTFYSLAKTRERIKDKLWSADYVSDNVINDWINEWKEKMTNAAVQTNEDYSIGTAAVSFAGTTELGTITATDFRGRLKRVWISTDGVNTFQATKMDSNRYQPNQIFNSTHPFFYMLGDSVMGRQPHETSGTATIEYYTTSTPLVNDTDELPASMRPYTKSFIDYGLSQAYAKDGKTAEAKGKMDEAMYELDKFQREISPRNQTGPTMIETVEDTGQLSNEGWFN